MVMLLHNDVSLSGFRVDSLGVNEVRVYVTTHMSLVHPQPQRQAMGKQQLEMEAVCPWGRGAWGQEGSTRGSLLAEIPRAMK